MQLLHTVCLPSRGMRGLVNNIATNTRIQRRYTTHYTYKADRHKTRSQKRAVHYFQHSATQFRLDFWGFLQMGLETSSTTMLVCQHVHGWQAYPGPGKSTCRSLRKQLWNQHCHFQTISRYCVLCENLWAQFWQMQSIWQTSEQPFPVCCSMKAWCQNCCSMKAGCQNRTTVWQQLTSLPVPNVDNATPDDRSYQGFVCNDNLICKDPVTCEAMLPHGQADAPAQG